MTRSLNVKNNNYIIPTLSSRIFINRSQHQQTHVYTFKKQCARNELCHSVKITIPLTIARSSILLSVNRRLIRKTCERRRARLIDRQNHHPEHRNPDGSTAGVVLGFAALCTPDLGGTRAGPWPTGHN